MKDDSSTTVLAQLKDYLRRRSAFGHDLVYRLNPPRVLEAGSAAERNGHTAGRRKKQGAVLQESLFASAGGSEMPGLDVPDLAALEEIVSCCTLCHLCEGRTRTVFGSGPPDARLVFVGEAPGREEDLQGLPFVGRAGQLLTKILASVGMSREEVYITNILKCRPPENRDPNDEECRACEPYLRRQLELIDPVLICALGRIAGQKLLGRSTPLSVLRQGVHYYGDTKLLVMYHPAALLRNPNLKRDAWEDIKRVRALLDEWLGQG